MFDPEMFMTQETDESFDTDRTPLDPGEYTCLVDDVEAKTVGDSNRPILNCKLRLTNQADDDLNGFPLFYTIWLDINEAGALERGPNKNIGLGQMLEAVGLQGKPWSPTMFKGQVVTVQVNHRLDKRNNSMTENVTRVTAA